MQTYYSIEAFEMDQWAREVTDRLKASRIYKAAQSLEQRYRDNHRDEVNDPYRRPAVHPGKPPSTGSSVQRAI